MSPSDAIRVDPLLAETVDRLLAASCSSDVIEQAEVDGWCASVWEPLAEAGFPWVSISEEAGGSGGTLTDALEIVRAVGRHAAPVPLAETAILGGWLAAASGLTLPDGPLTVVSDPSRLTIEGGYLRGAAPVAWARSSDAILAVVDTPDHQVVVSITPAQVDIHPRANMAGEPRDLVAFDLALDSIAVAEAPEGVDADALRLRGCLSRIVLSAGALAAMSQLTIDYTNERRQFGRPVARFQAVQHHLVTVAEGAVRASMAADVATRAMEHGGDCWFEVAAARLVVDAAAVEATRAAHQAHGAMGVAREYPLQQLSRRLWAWRHEYGPAREWRRQLGRQITAAGPAELFTTVTR
ncbi:MAG TPA: acyl-CoA dehydrogenase family protein [Acidimicrobiales bacterium]